MPFYSEIAILKKLMDKINKFLLKVTQKERRNLSALFLAIKNLQLSKYDIKPLQGMSGIFRLRKGNIRIIFMKEKNQGIILDIAFRKDIYKNLQ